MKVVWLSQYNILELLPQIKLNREEILHSSSWIHTLSHQLALNKEIELHIITYSQLVEATQMIKKNGIHFHVIKYNFPFTKKGFPWYFPLDKLTAYYSFSKKAQKIIDKIGPDVLHVHGTEGGYFLPTLKTRVPCIISIQGIIGEIVKLEPNVSAYLQVFYEKYAIRNGKYFGCRTNFDSQYVKRTNPNAVILNLPEAMNKVFFEQQWKAPPGLSMLYVGSVIRRKGIEDLIYALYKLKESFPTIKLKIIGSGTKKYHEKLMGIIKNLNLQSNIFWLGNKSAAEVATELSNSSLFVLPSLIDNSPNCLVEAMAVGVPSIATSVGGITSLVDDKYDGMLFEKHNIDELVRVIKILAKDLELQHTLSINGRKKALKENFPSKVAEIYIAAYKSIIA